MAKKTKASRNLYYSTTFWLGIGISLSLMIVGVIGFGVWWYDDRPWPGVKLAGEVVGNKNSIQITERLRERSAKYNYLTLFNGEQERQISLKDLGWKIEVEKSIHRAVRWGKSWHEWPELVQLWKNEVDLPIEYFISEEAVDAWLTSVAAELDIPAIEPTVQVIKDESSKEVVVVYPGSLGQLVNQLILSERIEEALRNLSNELVVVPVERVDLRLTDEQQEVVYDQAQKLLSKQVFLTGKEKNVIWRGADLISLLGNKGEIDERRVRYLIGEVAAEVNQSASNGRFVFDPTTQRMKEFQPEQTGLALDQERLFKEAMVSLRLLSEEATDAAQLEMKLDESPAEVRVGDLNELGIRSLLGKGASMYKGSIPGRRHNVALGANRVKGILIKPGEQFSFNERVGEVSAATGYQQAYVIRRGQTVLDDGGGICQVSTTVFRAALNAGLPILERKAHSYRVGYYEQDVKAGLDATVFAPRTDLVFLNDTPGYILVQTTVDEKHSQLMVEIFGTDDGRQVELSKPRLWEVTPPPEDLYTDDPTLPVGQVKQIEYKAWGAKAAFDWKVMRDGEVLQEKTFFSSYQPWGAVFLRGTKIGG